MVLGMISKTIGLYRKLQIFLPRAALITIYKAFIKPHLDYGDILYDQAYFNQKLESLWSHTRHIERKYLPNTRFTPITALV